MSGSWRFPDAVAANRVEERDGAVTVITGANNQGAPPAKSLERWLRKSARNAIEQHATVVAKKLGVEVGRMLHHGSANQMG